MWKPSLHHSLGVHTCEWEGERERKYVCMCCVYVYRIKKTYHKKKHLFEKKNNKGRTEKYPFHTQQIINCQNIHTHAHTLTRTYIRKCMHIHTHRLTKIVVIKLGLLRYFILLLLLLSEWGRFFFFLLGYFRQRNSLGWKIRITNRQIMEWEQK